VVWEMITVHLLMAIGAVAGAPGEGGTCGLLRVASVQMEISDIIDTNLQRIEKGIHEAGVAGARLVIFPESALSGFDETTIGRLDWERLEQAASKVSEAAREHRVYVLYGTTVKSRGAKPYNTAILLGPDGKEITQYHKMVPEEWFEPGDHLSLFEIDGVPCTMIICRDQRFPELVRIPVLSGAQVCFLLSYTVDSPADALRKREGYRAQIMARAVENSIWMVQSNAFGSPPGSEKTSFGRSRIVDPGGTVVAEAPEMAEALLVQDIRPLEANRKNAIKSLNIAPLSDWWREGVKRSGLKAPSDAGSKETNPGAR